jgi:hypothetical protein
MITKKDLLQRIDVLKGSYRYIREEMQKIDRKIKSICTHPTESRQVSPNIKFTAYFNGYPSESEVTGYRVICSICDTVIVNDLSTKEACEYRISIEEATLKSLS